MKNFTILLLLTGIIVFTSFKKIDNTNAESIELDSISFTKVNKVYVDHSGVKWFVTDQGLVSHNNDDWDQFTFEVSDQELIDVAYQLSSYGDELWLANIGGAVVAAYDVDAISSATVYTTANSDILSDTVTAIALDKNNARWIATPKGISLFRGNKWFDTTNVFLTKFRINAMAGDSAGWMFLATQGGGVGRYKFAADAFTGASTYEDPCYCPSGGIQTNDVNTIFIDEDTVQWYGTTMGVSKHGCFLAKECWTIYNKDSGLISNNVRAIAKDISGRMFFGTDSGVTVLDTTELDLSSFTVTDGLISNYINGIAADPDGSMWFATDKGISHRTADGVFTNYTGKSSGVGINEKNQYPVSVYPDITDNRIIITPGNLLSMYNVEIYSINGNLTIQKQGLTGKQEIILAGQQAGFYVVRISTDKNEVFIKKILLIK